MKNVIIIGAGGFAREVYWLIHTVMRYNSPDWQIKGFLDDRTHILNDYNYPHSVIACVEEYEPEENDVFACGIGTPPEREHYCKIILDKGGEFVNVIHPFASVSDNITWGTGIVVSAYSSISCDVKIGDFVAINSYAQIGHDVHIGDYSHINSLTSLGGFSRIGRSVTIHPHAVILPKVSIGDNVLVGAGSIVLKNVKSDQTVFGMPATPIKVNHLAETNDQQISHEHRI